MTKYRDTLIGAVVICISIALFAVSFGIQEFTRTSLGAGFVPRVTAVVFCLLGIVLIVRERRQRRAAVPTPQVAAEPVRTVGLTGALPVVLNIALFVGYLLLLEKVGFLILTPIYLFLQILLLTNPAKFRIVRFLILSVIVSVASYYMFVNFFQVMLPNGILE